MASTGTATCRKRRRDVKETEDIEDKMYELSEKINANQEELRATIEKLENEVKKAKEELLGEQVRNVTSKQPMRKEFLLKHPFRNVLAMHHGVEQFSKTENHFGISWRICFYRRIDDVEIHLECVNELDNESRTIEASYGICLLLSGTTITKVSSNVFHTKGDTNGIRFMSWEEFRRMVEYDTVIVTIHVTITKMSLGKPKLRDFSVYKPDRTTLTLKVGDEKFHVSKDFLADQSTFFEALLYAPGYVEYGKEEVELKVTDAEDFQKYLEVVYGEDGINDETVERILFVADQYHAKNVFEKCEKFLIGESKKEEKDKYEMSVRFQLSKLTEHCLSKIKYIAEYKHVVMDSLDNIDLSVAKALVRKATELNCC